MVVLAVIAMALTALIGHGGAWLGRRRVAACERMNHRESSCRVGDKLEVTVAQQQRHRQQQQQQREQ